MRYRESLGSKLFDLFNSILICALIVVMAYPFVYIFLLSVSHPTAISLGEVVFWPVRPHLKAYAMIFEVNNIANSYRNTIIYTIVGTGLTLFFAVTMAFPLSRRDLKGRRGLMLILAVTLFMQSGMIPKFLLIKEMHLLDTIWAVTLPSAFSMWYVVLCRTNFQGIPDALIESAGIDGAGMWRILFQIVLPLSKPILVTVALFSSVEYWNDFMNALLYINDTKWYPLQMVLRRLLTVADNINEISLGDFEDAGTGTIRMIQAAATVVTVGPIILIYPFVQKYFIKGAMIGSLKE